MITRRRDDGAGPNEQASTEAELQTLLDQGESPEIPFDDRIAFPLSASVA